MNDTKRAELVEDVVKRAIERRKADPLANINAFDARLNNAMDDLIAHDAANEKPPPGFEPTTNIVSPRIDPTPGSNVVETPPGWHTVTGADVLRVLDALPLHSEVFITTTTNPELEHKSVIMHDGERKRLSLVYESKEPDMRKVVSMRFPLSALPASFDRASIGVKVSRPVDHVDVFPEDARPVVAPPAPVTRESFGELLGLYHRLEKRIDAEEQGRRAADEALRRDVDGLKAKPAVYPVVVEPPFKVTDDTHTPAASEPQPARYEVVKNEATGGTRFWSVRRKSDGMFWGASSEEFVTGHIAAAWIASESIALAVRDALEGGKA